MRGAMRSTLAVCSLGLVLVGCDDDKKAAGTGAPAEESDPFADVDWTGRALAPVQATVDGVDFTVELPADLTIEEKAAARSFPGYVTWRSRTAFAAPGFTAQVDEFPPTDAESASRRAGAAIRDSVVTRADALDDGGFLVTLHEGSKELLITQIWREGADGSWVRFSVMQRTSEPMLNLPERAAWMESVARSFQPR